MCLSLFWQLFVMLVDWCKLRSNAVVSCLVPHARTAASSLEAWQKQGHVIFMESEAKTYQLMAHALISVIGASDKYM